MTSILNKYYDRVAGWYDYNGSIHARFLEQAISRFKKLSLASAALFVVAAAVVAVAIVAMSQVALCIAVPIAILSLVSLVIHLKGLHFAKERKREQVGFENKEVDFKRKIDAIWSADIHSLDFISQNDYDSKVESLDQLFQQINVSKELVQFNIDALNSTIAQRVSSMTFVLKKSSKN
jgi:hypothetical protein